MISLGNSKCNCRIFNLEIRLAGENKKYSYFACNRSVYEAFIPSELEQMVRHVLWALVLDKGKGMKVTLIIFPL